MSDEKSDHYEYEDSEFAENADRAYQELLARVGESAPQPRLEPTRRVVELLGDPQRSYPIIHITGTNGKTSVARMIESILRAYGLRTGLATSPHLERPNERISIDGEPISNRAFAENWADVRPYIDLVDAELQQSGEEPLTYFEAFTVLTFAAFADAPVDVAVVEVGMGGEWDSTNVADGQVAVFTPISLDHTQRLGSTVQQIARTKAGIIKPVAAVVSAEQVPEALAELERAADLTESTLNVEGAAFELLDSTVAVGGQVISVRGLAGEYKDIFLPLYGTHQGHNAALAIAAVESFLGQGSQALVGDVLTEGLATATSPGRLQLVGKEPTVLVDAAHNPHGAAALADAIRSYFTFDEIAVVVGVLGDKDAAGIIEALAPVTTTFLATQSSSERAIPATDLAELIARVAPEHPLQTFESLEFAVQDARVWAAQAPRRAVLVTGSITLIGEVIGLSAAEGWK
ncbi:dihydrofolate synthase/folylpolyglutamate synthase [Leifsonia sp. AK011]|uniref:bifunctional folylpolyglutamate synthase/dihydrofolate synthase n=1 Tax=Leifsonia sp. AK011 TaxID=2723075 RepID=UPI0015C8A0E4|nr:folylpolyglutamate synthase/dihydrofolate synthase family protein [Leifsonia sp. AK011]NYF11043.1 dihydrofolate synthase/folylpolyglutamate synthase [Leifsonia sp. AK011]